MCRQFEGFGSVIINNTKLECGGEEYDTYKNAILFPVCAFFGIFVPIIYIVLFIVKKK